MLTISSILILAGILLFTGCGRNQTITEAIQGPEVLEEPGLTDQFPQEEPEDNSEILYRAEIAIEKAVLLRQQYFYDEALEVLADETIAELEMVRECAQSILEEKNELVDYTGDIPHIFFHSLIVYPELIFTDKQTPMGGYNSGFSEKVELEKILPQLYERGYVLYDLGELYEQRDGQMVRKEILLPPGKIPLILSVDDVAYAYGLGFAEKLLLDENGQLLYSVPNPEGERDLIPDGDVMGVVDQFVAEHPDFSYHGHKGTIALTGFQGAFGYYPYTDDAQYELDAEIVSEMCEIVNALKAEGWNFASHSYTHNGVNNLYCQGCSYDKIYYDINKWLLNVTQYTGTTRLFIAPFGFRVPQPALQAILDAGFDIYCTVDDHVYNEVNEDYFLMSRIEIGGYSMTNYRELLNEWFFDPDSVFDAEGRPPVI